MENLQEQSKWNGLPVYDQPLGLRATTGPDDGRPVEWITDFSRCMPTNHWSRDAAPGRWQSMDYATESFAGNLLHAVADNPAPDLTLALNAKGWYAVYVWIMGADSGIPPNQFDSDCAYSGSPGPALKLNGDRRFHYRFRALAQQNMKAPGLEGCFWRYADLTDQSLTIRHQGGTVYLAALQLVPLAPSEVEAIKRDRADRSLKRLIVKGDSESPAQIEQQMELLRDGDVGGWIVGNDNSADLEQPGGSRNLTAFKRACDEIGVESYVCDRPSLWSSHRFSDNPRFRWFEQHSEFQCRERDGTPSFACSYAIPTVVDYMLARVMKSVAAGVDGFGYFFNRDPHGMVRFEPAAVAGFEERHGVDPLTLDDRDERLVQWRADIITAFLRRVRETLDQAAGEKGFKRIKMIHVVLGDETANRYASLDVARWVKEGLVDILCPYPFADYPEWWMAQGAIPVDVKYFASLVNGTGCKLVPMWLSNRHREGWVREHVRSNEFFTKAIQDYKDGADGLTAWDSYFGLDAMFPANRWLHLGHKNQLEDWASHDFPLPPFRRLNRLGGATVRRLPPGSGG